MQRIYRLEIKNNPHKGVYSYGFQGIGRTPAYVYDDNCDDNRMHNDSGGRPGPYNDFVNRNTGDTLNINKNEHCGFSSIEQLLAWFPSEEGREAMKENCDIVIGVYETNNYRVAEKQAVFILNEEERIDELSVVEI